MQRAVIQIPVSADLRRKAEIQALKQGFSSLQEVLRVFMSKLAAKRINISLEEAIILSPKAEKRYAKIDEDFKKGKNIYRAKNINHLMKRLRGNSLS